MMLSLDEEQSATLQEVADHLPPEKRAAFIERTVAYLELHGDYDPAVDAFDRAVNLALRDITQAA
jgi:hypothetical protein